MNFPFSSIHRIFEELEVEVEVDGRAEGKKEEIYSLQFTYRASSTQQECSCSVAIEYLTLLPLSANLWGEERREEKTILTIIILVITIIILVITIIIIKIKIMIIIANNSSNNDMNNNGNNNDNKSNDNRYNILV